MTGGRGAGRRGMFGVLGLIGVGWGLGLPFWKMATEAGLPPLGLMLWQLLFIVAVLGPLMLLRRQTMPLGRRHLIFYGGLALFGAVIPNLAYYTAIGHLPAGILAITVATVPIFSLLLATLLGHDRPRPLRILGVCLGLAAVALLAKPGALPEAGSLPFLLIGLISAASYAIEGNWVVSRAIPGVDPVMGLLGGSLLALLVVGPLAVATGNLVPLWTPWGPGEWGVVVGGTTNAFCYVGYLWLVGRAGPVFAAQVGYIVTLSAVFWSGLVLGERYGPEVWGALAILIAGLALVQPRRAGPPPLEPGAARPL